eukprot:m.21412 g.21412  ORF g.21412 m.21412 type:complete len:321 (+) comp6403_c0_seq1:377-1339(+)
MAAPRQTPLTCSGHTRPVVDLAFSPITPDGYFVVSACKDGKPMLREGNTGDWLGTFEGHKGAVWGATLNATAERVATGAADFSAKVWDAISGDELTSFSHPHIVKAVDFSSNDDRLLTGCNDKALRVFDLGRPDAEPLVLKGHTGSVKKALFAGEGGDDTKIVSGGDDKVIRLWDARSGTEAISVPVSSSITNVQLSWCKDLAVVTYGKQVAFYEPTTLKLVKVCDVEFAPYAAALHPEKKTFVWGGEDNYLHVCDFETGAQKEEYKGHFGPVHCVSFSPDGELYASGSEDGTVRLWQTNVGTEYGLWRFTKPEEAATAE